MEERGVIGLISKCWRAMTYYYDLLLIGGVKIFVYKISHECICFHKKKQMSYTK